MLDARIVGSAQLRAVADSIRATGDRGLAREMSTALQRAAKPVKASIRAEADRVMPSRGGYQQAFSRSLHFRTTVRNANRQAFFRLLTFADGTSERRDIRALEAGRLRHPVFGRSRNTRLGRIPNPWSATRITPGFHQRGTADAADAAEAEMKNVLDEFASRLAKG